MIFNPLDGLILLGLGAGAFWGFSRGSLRELIDVVCLYLATLATTLVFQRPARWFALNFDLPLPFTEILTFTLLLAGFFSFFLYIALDFLKPPRGRYLTITDRMGGMIFGLLFALILISLVLFFLDHALKVNWLRWDQYRKAILETRIASLIAPFIEEFGRTILLVLRPFFPKGLPSLLEPRL
ncbi:MAG: CvpA family protein [Anaerolineae bacterium]|nr:CvpA family protein [Anaerolineae bacterium]MDW8101817.1 CvpA family protein [Anaerolineae bacterium]